ncbi:MAG: TAXI family TRAP transporter solute-binding subunit, partial [Kiloniellales bacterium]|nr:TAXI family TRAP transporter solute-binding subunit [Kiloniellales bacterium]
PMTQLRAVASLHPVALQVVTLERSGIRRIDDLRGRRVALGGPGSATRPIARRVLAAHGLGEDAIDARDLEPEIALERLAAGKLDAFFALGAVPLDAVARVAAIAEIRLLPVSAARLADDPAVAGTTVAASIPAGAYMGVPEAETLAMPVQLLVGEDLGEDLVYAMTVRLWAPGTRQRLGAAVPMAGDMTLEGALDGLEAPLHPGAARFYRDRGLLP